MIAKRRHSYLSLPWAACLLVTPVAPPWALALQPLDGAEPGHVQRSNQAYLDDSLEAADAIARAQAHALRGQWDEAAALLQETSDKAANRLVRLDEGQYTNVRAHVNELIAAWPEEGLRAYRRRFEPAIQDELDRLTLMQTHSVDTLLNLFERYFCTQQAAELADSTAQMAMESGDLDLARRLYQAVVDGHPDGARYARHYQSIIYLLRVMESEKVNDPPDEIRETTLSWMGHDRSLNEIVDQVRVGFRHLSLSPSPGDWPIVGGDATRNRRPASEIDELGLLWRLDALAPNQGTVGASNREFEDDRYDARARWLTIQPVTFGGLIYVQMAREVVALHRRTGAVAWRFRAEEAAAASPVEFDDEPSAWDAVTVADGCVYASFPAESAPRYTYDAARHPAELICLDAVSGREIWRSPAHRLTDAFSETTFDSSPVVRNGHLWVVGRRRRSFGFEDCFLYRFNARTGAFEQRTHVGGASTGVFGSRQPTRAAIAIGGDTAFVAGNLGTVAAVSIHTGRVRWLRTYPRDRFDQDNSLAYAVRDVKPWHFNPVIVDQDRVVVLPMDSGRLLVLNALDGRRLHTLDRDHLGRAESLLGIRGDLLCTVGPSAVCYDLAVGSPRWSASLPTDVPTFGQGIWANKSILVPTRSHLLVLDELTGKSRTVSWDAEGEGGNLLAFPGELLVAGVGRLSAYVRKSEIWTTLRDRVSASPADPMPAVEWAEIALSNGEYDEAIAALQEAGKRADASRETMSAALRGRLFDDAMMFSERLFNHNRLTNERLDLLFDLAAHAAPDTQANLLYRLRFAVWFEKTGRPERAVRLYQQFLRDASLSDLPVPSSPDQAKNAAVMAQERIDDLISANGRDIYAPFEDEAQRMLSAAAADADEGALARLVQWFPNSLAAPQALIAQADLLVKQRRGAAAAALLSRAYHQYPRFPDRPALLRLIADAYETADMKKRAYLWLTKAAREHPSHRFESEGRRVTFAEYRSRLSDVASLLEPSRPTLTLPLSRPITVEWDRGASLLEPRFADDPSADWSVFYAITDDGIRAFKGRTAAGRWSEPAPSRTRTQLLVATSRQAVFANLYEVFALDVETGDRRWSHGTIPERLNLVEGDWENGAVLRQFALHEGRLLFQRDSGEMTLVDLSTGRALWSHLQRPRAFGPIALSDEWVAYPSMDDPDARFNICLLNVDTGAWVRGIQTEEKRSMEDVLITMDGRVVLAGSQSVSAYDPHTQRLLWRTPLEGFLRKNSLVPDIDAVFLSSDGRSIKKISWEDGAVVWESEPLARRGDEDITVVRQGVTLLVGTSTSIAAVDTVTGLTLWRGTTPESPRFINRRVTSAYLVAIHVVQNGEESANKAFFYDHRNASGVIARDGGTLSLGSLPDIRAMLVVNDALLIQTGHTLRGWTREP